MKSFLLTWLACCILSLLPTVVAAAPVVPGLHSKHPLDPTQTGDVLLNEMRCAACHKSDEAHEQQMKAAPDLSDVGARVSPEFLQRMIASPAEAHPGSTMPDLLHAQSPEQRAQIAEAISHFLIAQSSQPFKRDAIAEQDVTAGQELFHTVGCIACHAPRDARGQEITSKGVVDLTHLTAKTSRAALGEFLFQPLRVRPAGRMPDMKLTRGEAQAIASYLLGPTKVETVPFQPQKALVTSGRKYYEQFNCSACHKLADIPAAKPAQEFAKLDPQQGCLDRKSVRSPQFRFSDAQMQALRAALAPKREPADERTQVAATLTTFNCIACHTRGDYGGVAEERDLLFQTSEKNLGDDARIPPPLTLVGAKLQTLWMKKVLFDAESVRPYMFTRMPQYGEANIGHLPEVFARLDKVEEVELAIPNPENAKDRAREKELRAAGRELLGDKGLYCIACHNFNGKLSPNHKGIDLMTSFERLKPSWFYHFMREPVAYRPRILMPVSWPDGQAVQRTILDGDTDSQIEAIWYYLSLGTSAADPPGIRGVETRLEVTETARTYRGRSNIAGTRGIAVGFPGGLNYAFNAETGTLTGIWRGDFVRVDRSGQGAGSFHPLTRAVALAQDVAFLDLADEQTPWPLRPQMTKEQPVNPDPLYPKNHGYQFKGYYFDAAFVPTLMYRSGEIEIEDRSTAKGDGEKAVLERTLSFSAPKARTLWFRALTGKIDSESDQVFKVANLRLSIPKTPTLLRPLEVADEGQELLLKLEIPSGKSKVTMTYDLLP